jgi:hypothetical protein
MHYRYIQFERILLRVLIVALLITNWNLISSFYHMTTN